MHGTTETTVAVASGAKSRLDRALALFTDVRAGEGATAVLMLVNVFLLLVCYSVIKTVREPLILLGGGAEVRSYAAAGQALLLMGFVPLYSLVASRVGRMKLLVGVTLFFVACIELFALAVSARVPYVGVAFFIWVGIFNISLVAQFWSFANDIYRRDAGDRLFPDHHDRHDRRRAARLVRRGPALPRGTRAAGHSPGLGAAAHDQRRRSTSSSTAARRGGRGGAAQPLAPAGGFAPGASQPYLRLVAALVVLLNIVNTTGEYLVARLLTPHVAELAAATPGFNKQAFIGAFSGDYQFWVNVTALAAPGVRDLAAGEDPRAAGRAARAAADRARRLRHDRGRRRLHGRALDQDGGKRHRLLDHEHGAPAAVAADDARGEVQGEAGDRHASSSAAATCCRRWSSTPGPACCTSRPSSSPWSTSS